MTGTVRKSGVDWTPETILKLKFLWGEKLSATQVAEQIPGATRNAIIGKVHRLGLPPKTRENSPSPNRVKRTPKIRRISMPPTPVPQMIVLAEPPTGKIEFLSLGNKTCRSVEGYSLQEGHHLPYYCSNPKGEEESFCAYHQGIYYRKAHEDR